MKQVKWSKKSVQELDEILEYWSKRNKSQSYSEKIIREITNAIVLIKNQPNVGVETNHRKVKMRLVLNRFYLVYRTNEKNIEILKFWDCRQNPTSNPYFK